MKIRTKIQKIRTKIDNLDFLNRKKPNSLIEKMKLRGEKIKVLIEIYEDFNWLREKTPVDVVYVGFCNAYLYRVQYKSVWEGINIQCNEDFLTIGKDETDFISNPLAQLKQALIDNKIDISTLTITEF